MSSEKPEGIDEQPSVTKSGKLVLIEKREATETTPNNETRRRRGASPLLIPKSLETGLNME